jgi:hypothetical protein
MHAKGKPEIPDDMGMIDIMPEHGECGSLIEFYREMFHQLQIVISVPSAFLGPDK